MREQLRRLGLLSLVASLQGFLGSIASIESGWGWPGVVACIMLSIMVLFVASTILRSVLARTERGTTLLRAIDSVGLTDIENREDDTIRALPPVAFYSGATHEVLITGVTGYRTFDQHIATVRELLKRGRHVYIVILHPRSAIATALSSGERKDIVAEIGATLDIIRREQLMSNPAFHMRFIDRRAPYTAVMTDGDVAPTGSTPRDSHGRVRVQPAASFETQHKGIVLQFAKRSGPSAGGFDYFAQDLRREWQEAREDQSLLTQLSGATA